MSIKELDIILDIYKFNDPKTVISYDENEFYLESVDTKVFENFNIDGFVLVKQSLDHVDIKTKEVNSLIRFLNEYNKIKNNPEINSAEFNEELKKRKLDYLIDIQREENDLAFINNNDLISEFIKATNPFVFDEFDTNQLDNLNISIGDETSSYEVKDIEKRITTKVTVNHNANRDIEYSVEFFLVPENKVLISLNSEGDFIVNYFDCITEKNNLYKYNEDGIYKAFPMCEYIPIKDEIKKLYIEKLIQVGIDLALTNTKDLIKCSSKVKEITI